MTRERAEHLMIGRRIVAVNWAARGPFGKAADVDQVESLTLDDGQIIQLCGSAQIEIDAVYLDVLDANGMHQE